MARCLSLPGTKGFPRMWDLWCWNWHGLQWNQTAGQPIQAISWFSSTVHLVCTDPYLPLNRFMKEDQGTHSGTLRNKPTDQIRGKWKRRVISVPGDTSEGTFTASASHTQKREPCHGTWLMWWHSLSFNIQQQYIFTKLQPSPLKGKYNNKLLKKLSIYIILELCFVSREYCKSKLNNCQKWIYICIYEYIYIYIYIYILHSFSKMSTGGLLHTRLCLWLWGPTEMQRTLFFSVRNLI